MAELNAKNPTLLDLARLKDPDGTVADIVEIMNETNEVMQDISFREGNLTTGHRSTIRAGIPAPTYTRLYGGVQPTKGTTVQVEDTCAILEAYSEIDKRLADLENNQAAYRMSEDRVHIEGFAQEVANGIFYNDEDVSPEKFTGLAPRYNSLSADNAENIVVGGGLGSDNASIWLVVWGPQTCMGIIPKGSVAGMQVRDLGEDTKVNPDGSMYQVYRTHYRFDVGLTLKDWRYVVRIPNIDRSSLSTTWTSGAFSGGADLSDLMHQAITQVPNLNAGRATFYCDRSILGTLRRQVSAKTNESTLQAENVGGTLQTSFMGIPLRRCDALSGNEAAVS